MNLWYYVGLIIFVTVLVVDIAAMITDLVLVILHQWTITHRMMGQPIAVIIVILWQIFGTLGLALHFANNYALQQFVKRLLGIK
jgi:hypothetical protein